ncbi:MAG: Fur family transcriptional regulator [Phycisphaeraceae bacterium]
MSDRIDDVFALRGLRCTKQRKAVFSALSATTAHPTADELFHEVRQQIPGVSLATVYNTLEAFCRAGLVQKLPGVGINGSARYDATRDDHLHLRCERTGTVADVPEDLDRKIRERIPKSAIKELEQRLGFKINQIQIELVGEYSN